MVYTKFAADTFVIALAHLLIALSSIILLPVFTKILGPYEYGLWVQISVTIVLVYSLVELGLPFSMNRFLAAEKRIEEIREGFYSILFIVLF